MRLIASVALGALAMPAIAAPAGDQFDLVCKAKRDGQRYRIDLAKNEWCADKCGTVRKIASVTSGTLVLADQKPAIRGEMTNTIIINRVTGAWHTYFYWPKAGGLPSTTDGSCEPAPFSGFSSAPTKF